MLNHNTELKMDFRYWQRCHERQCNN